MIFLQGGIRFLIDIINSHLDAELIALCSWGLKNIAVDCFDEEMIPVLLRLLRQYYSHTNIKNHCVTALCQLCSDPPDIELIEPVIDPLCYELIHETNPEIVTELLVALALLFQHSPPLLFHLKGRVFCVKRIISALFQEDVQIAALELLAIISESDGDPINDFLDHDLLSSFADLLAKNDLRTKDKQRILWTLSNITAGTTEQVSRVINNKDLMQKIADILNYDPDFETKQEVQLQQADVA
jgi:hypothetical protein